MSKLNDDMRQKIDNLISLGQTSKDIAQELGLPVGTVSARRAWITRNHANGPNQEPSGATPSLGKGGLSDLPGWADEVRELRKPPKGLPNKPLMPGSRLEDDGDNQATLTYVGNRIPKSIPELLRWCSVDEKVWRPLRSVVNMWTVTMKMGSKDKHDEHYAETHPNWQIKTFLIRKEPLEVTVPLMRPVIMKKGTNFPKREKSTKAGIKTALVFGDSQIGYRKNQLTNDMQPFHDRKNLDVIAQVNAYLKPDVRIYLGDMLDFAPWSLKFRKESGFHYTTQPSLMEWAWWLKLYERVPSMESYWLKGNHEQRIDDTIMDKMVELLDLKKVQKDIKLVYQEPAVTSIRGLMPILDQLNVEFIDDYPGGRVWLNDNVRVSHGSKVRKGSGASVAEILKEARATEIVGHTHRLEAAHKTAYPMKGPVTYGAYSMGTTARIDGAVPAATDRVDWQPGFGVVNYTDEGYFHVTQYSINDGRVILDKTLFEAGDQEELRATISEDIGLNLNRIDPTRK